MLPVVICALVLTVLIRYLKNKILTRNNIFPDGFTPDYGETPEKRQHFANLASERRERWAKKEAERVEKLSKKDVFHSFDKEMEFLKAKNELERKQPIPKRATYQCAMDLYKIGQLEKARKIQLAKLRKEIYERDIDNGNSGGQACPKGNSRSNKSKAGHNELDNNSAEDKFRESVLRKRNFPMFQ